MFRYRFKLRVYNTREPFPPATVTLVAEGDFPEDALRRIGVVYVSADGLTANVTGGLPRWYDECRLAGRPRRVRT